MRIRRIAFLIDGGFFARALPRLLGDGIDCSTPQCIADWAENLCRQHVQHLIGEPFDVEASRWHDHVYRIFYYDAKPFEGRATNPVNNQETIYSKTSIATSKNELFRILRTKRKFALRLGEVVKQDGWQLYNSAKTVKLLRTKQFIHVLESAIVQSEQGVTPEKLSELEIRQLRNMIKAWAEFGPADIRLTLKQKGVDMRIGVDISTLTLKKQVDTIILVTGDSDFVPAAKVARREGVEVILDSLGQNINDDLYEHVDAVSTVLRRPAPEVKSVSKDEE